jgi:hypothetical protein
LFAAEAGILLDLLVSDFFKGQSPQAAVCGD